MLNKKVIIRVDGNSSFGLGHIYRGIALAEILKEEFTIEFITSLNTTISPIKESDFNYYYIPKSIDLLEEPIWLKENYSIDTIVVLDGYKFKQSYQQRIKDCGFRLVYIDDLAEGTQKADLVINHSPGAKESDYKTEEYTKLALGLKYALLRKSFSNFNRELINKRGTIKNVFISFGGADNNDFSYKTAIEILKPHNKRDVNIVLGAAYNGKDIFKLADSRIHIHNNLSEQEVFDLMKDTDLAIVPASTISIELASLGVPMILGYYIDNQKGIYDGFIRNDTVKGINDFNKLDFVDICKIIKSLNNPSILNKQSQSLIKLFAGNPKHNILQLFEFNQISLKPADDKDMMFVFNLSNDPVIRSNSYDTKQIEYKQHEDWFQKQINDDSILFYIVEFENKQIGQVRFNIKSDYSVIGISISREYRGKGFAAKTLNQAAEIYFKEKKQPIYAYIKKPNLPSIKSFKKAGFSFLKEEIIKNIDSYVFKKDNS